MELNLLHLCETGRAEHNAWISIWRKMQELFDVTQEEINKPKYREIAVLIEKWGCYERERRKALSEGTEEERSWADEKRGVFWNGDD